MTVTVWVLGDQLTPLSSAFSGLGPGDCVVLMIESRRRAAQAPFHKKKLALVWAAMRHFAAELRESGYEVDYHAAEPDFDTGLTAHLRQYRPARVRIMETAAIGGAERLAEQVRARGTAVEVAPNNAFLSDGEDFARWARGKKALRLETFYRHMRRRTGLLMDGDEPVGGRWNYDERNRERPPDGHDFPPVPAFEPDAMTQSAMEAIAREFPRHFGEVDGFRWPVTRRDAEAFADDFLDRRLDLFGPYEDAIVTGEPVLYHSLLSPLLNIGLLDPLTLCREAERRYRDGRARLNSVEGFIRQIIGWREFVYRVYRLKGRGYLAVNHFGANLPLPAFYWTGDSDMHCVADAVGAVLEHGINHHIQRLMVTGNFALLAGIDPAEVNSWYGLAYVDAYEWVVSPNVLGLALYADGGLLASKPYAASANYINKMSDCCRRCRYDHRQSSGAVACPFNALYWDFLARNREALGTNPRMALALANLDRRDARELAAIRATADRMLAALSEGDRI